jgi:hypothetical protein
MLEGRNKSRPRLRQVRQHADYTGFQHNDGHLVAGLSIPSYTAAVMKWGFTKPQGITILVIATVALIILMIVVFRATSVH